MEQEVIITKEEVIETLNDFVFGNFDISMKVKTAINEAVCMLEKRDETIDRVLDIINKWKYDDTWCEREDIWNERMDAIKGGVLALKGEQE